MLAAGCACLKEKNQVVSCHRVPHGTNGVEPPQGVILNAVLDDRLGVCSQRLRLKARFFLSGDQSNEAAVFSDLGSSPACFEALRWADFYGSLKGNSCQTADAIQAYLQALFLGRKCWMELPPEAIPDEYKKLYQSFRRPVVLCTHAIYGHPDAGTSWEVYCDEAVKKQGFEPVGENWPSVYFHKKLKLLLVIYVDDLKMAGPTQNLKEGWSLLRQAIEIEPEVDSGLYLGCEIHYGSEKMSDGH